MKPVARENFNADDDMIAVIGCGNPNRSDDGVGPEVVRALRGCGEGGGVRLLDAGTDGMAVIFAARGCRTLIIIDACRSGSEPGAIFEVPGAELALPYQPSLNLHDFRWDHALHAGRMMLRDEFPNDVTVLLIEAETIDFGVGLSPAVSAAAAKVADRVERLIRERRPAAEKVGL
jgi:hydrogenase maturation protease